MLLIAFVRWESSVFATPMFVSPIAGALSDRIGRRPITIVGLSMLTAGFVWVAWHGSLATSWIELVTALLIGGVGISMAIPTVPTAVMSAVAPHEVGKASGINYMAQRFGAVVAIAIGSAVFSANGHVGSPASVTAGFRPARWACACFAVLAALTALHRLTIDAPPERVHQLAATREGIQRWWTGHPVAGDYKIGAQLSVYFRDPADPAATFEVVERTPEQLVWRCVAGPQNWIDTRTTYVSLKSGAEGHG